MRTYGPPAGVALPPVTDASAPVGVDALVSWEFDLLQVLHSISGNDLGISPRLRRQWRGCQVRLAVELGRRGVRAPKLTQGQRG
jgi:hypothetical protein